jgi:PKHD-type hydroxylase
MADTPLVYLLPESAQPGVDGNPRLHWPSGVDPFSAAVSLDENPAQATVQLVLRAFTAEECARILQLGESGQPVTATTEKVTGYRSSVITWIHPDKDARWLYHRIGLLFLNANRSYRFALAGLAEPLQFARYGDSGHFEWHTDMGVQGTSSRKLSLTIQLVAADAYDGGNLEFLSLVRRTTPREPGTAIIFPSYLAHRVAPVTRGQRCSLVAWAYGPALR